MAHKNSDLRNKYKEQYKKVSSLVNEFDPCGLIKVGAPLDEYDCLTDHIISSYQENKTKEEMRNTLIHELEYHFGYDSFKREPYKTKFDNALQNFLDKLDREIKK